MSATRDVDAIEAIRARLETIGGLWPIVWHNRKSQGAQITDFEATQGWILETPIGGPSMPRTIGTQTPVRERTKLYQLLLHAPVDSGLAHEVQAGLIEAGLFASPITMDPSDPDGPIAVMIDAVNVRPPRPQTKQIAHITRPVVVSYRLFAA